MTPEQATFKKQVGAALPAVLWSLTHEHLRENGYTVRQDMDVLVTRSLREAVKGLDPIHRNTVLDRAAEEASQMLRAANTNTPQALWVALAHAMLAAASRGVPFPENILLIASAVEVELAEHEDEFGGVRRVQRDATRIDNVGWANGWWRAPGETMLRGA